MKRREFLAGAALGGMSAILPGGISAAQTDKVKFLVFADIHYRFSPVHQKSREWLERILDRAKRENVDFVIQLGDFTQRPLEDIDYVNCYNDFSIKTYNVFGNHDDDVSPHEKVLGALRLESGHYFFDRNGFRFVVCDPNYIQVGSEFLHYSDGNHSKKKIAGATLDHMPPFELEWLKDVIDSSPHPCVVFSHQSFARERGSVAECREVRRILEEANAKTPGKVRLVMNGHHHVDFLTFVNGIPYWEMNSASYQWTGWKWAHNGYDEAVVKSYPSIVHSFVFDQPVSAVVTLDRGGLVRVDGERGRYFKNIDPVALGWKGDDLGRPATPNVTSLSMRFDF